MADYASDGDLHEPLAEAHRRAGAGRAITFARRVCRVDDVLGFDTHRRCPVAVHLDFCAAC